MHATVLQPASNGAEWGESAIWAWKSYRCHWRVLGEPEAPAMVLLHGFGASSSHWRHNAAPLSRAGYRVYGLDLIGFGRSEQPGLHPQIRLDNRLWARQLAAFVEQVVQKPAVLVGNSLGGLTALTTAAFRPELTTAVVAAPLPDPALIKPLPHRLSPRRRRLRNAAVPLLCRLLPLELLVPLISRTSLLRMGLQGAYSRSIRSDRELHQLIAHPARRRTAARSLRAMSVGMALRPRGATAPALLERLAKQDRPLPLLLLWGRQDRFVPLLIGENLQRQHSWLKLCVLDGSGHCPHDESPEHFHQELLRWLDINLERTSALEAQQRA